MGGVRAREHRGAAGRGRGRSKSRYLEQNPPARPTLFCPQAWSVVVLNSMTLALACSTYYSFCGNAAAGGGAQWGGGSGQSVKALVCSRWLPPVTAQERPVRRARAAAAGSAAAAADTAASAR